MSGIYRSDEVVSQAVIVRNKTTGEVISGLDDLVATIYDPNGTAIVADLEMTEIEDSGMYSFSRTPAELGSESGVFPWIADSPTANMIPIAGSFRRGGWVDNISSAEAGTYPVDHNFGGADHLTCYREGTTSGIGGIWIYAFLKSDFDAGLRSAPFRKGVAISGDDGRWLNVMMLEPGETYRLVFQSGSTWEEIGYEEITIPEE